MGMIYRQLPPNYENNVQCIGVTTKLKEVKIQDLSHYCEYVMRQNGIGKN